MKKNIHNLQLIFNSLPNFIVKHTHGGHLIFLSSYCFFRFRIMYTSNEQITYFFLVRNYELLVLIPNTLNRDGRNVSSREFRPAYSCVDLSFWWVPDQRLHLIQIGKQQVFMCNYIINDYQHSNTEGSYILKSSWSSKAIQGDISKRLEVFQQRRILKMTYTDRITITMNIQHLQDIVLHMWVDRHIESLEMQRVN